MQYFKEILMEQSKLHTAILPQDIVKLCYQATFGAEHLLLHRDKAFKYFMNEYTSIPQESTPVFEPICDSYARCNFAAWKQMELPAEWLFEMFYHTASEKSLGTEDLFWNYISIAESLLAENVFSFSQDKWNDYMAHYKMHGVTAVHHSENYRKNEHPAYRLINIKYTKLLPILEKLALQNKSNLSANSKANIIAIDGRAGAGKSTLAKLLSDILDAPIIQMDDFFLPPALRTESRLNESGGNVHYERFCEEVIPFLKKNIPFSYRIFDCHIMDYNGEKKVLPNQWYIVEGSYSMHPSFGNYINFSIFCDISPEEQLNRIRLRNGEHLLKRFVDTWIPIEEHYFNSQNIRKRCDIVIFL